MKINLSLFASLNIKVSALHLMKGTLFISLKQTIGLCSRPLPTSPYPLAFIKAS